MNVKVMVSLLIAMLADSFTLVYGLVYLNELESANNLATQTGIFVTGIKGFLFLATAYVVAITLFGVRRLVKDR